MNFESLVNQIVLMCITLNIGIQRLLTAKFAIFNSADDICRIRSLKIRHFAECRIYSSLEINLLFHKNIL